MAASATTQTLHDGERRAIIKIDIAGDGGGELSSGDVVTVSNLSGSPTRVKIDRIQWAIDNFAATLEWEATANVDAFTCSAGSDDIDFTPSGGIKNDAGSGITGDIDLTTLGAGANENGSIILYLSKTAF